MKNIYLLDCTLRDGGYINNWNFGEEAIRGICRKLELTGIEIIEIGFMRGDTYNPQYSLFPDAESMKNIITPKKKECMYVAMLDMSDPVPLERIQPYDGTSIDGIRVIFKKDKIEEAYTYCEKIQALGYKVFVNFVGTDNYSDIEFVEGINKFNKMMPYGIAIVDSFGLIKRKQFLRYAYLADNNMEENIILCYHAHNNLQQAFGNAEALVEMNLRRKICIDACVYGMGRGAGNLNLELFAEHLNENYGTQYRIEPMLEIMDEYLNEIHQTRYWGYSLPLYLSAATGCHPNYSIYFEEKGTLSVKSFNELLKSIPEKEKAVFSKERAEKYYKEYQENFVDDKETLEKLKVLTERPILILAPGHSLKEYKTIIEDKICEMNPIVISINFEGYPFKAEYVFCSNMRKFSKIKEEYKKKCIITSNIKKHYDTSIVINFSSYTSRREEIVDNAGIMLLNLLITLGVKEVTIAGMDGYMLNNISNYYEEKRSNGKMEIEEIRNVLVSEELSEIKKVLNMKFLTPTMYKL